MRRLVTLLLVSVATLPAHAVECSEVRKQCINRCIVRSDGERCQKLCDSASKVCERAAAKPLPDTLGLKEMELKLRGSKH